MFAQSKKIAIKVHNQLDVTTKIGFIKGDKFILIDSVQAKKGEIRCQVSKNNISGVYRIILCQTPIAQIMNEPPQQLDFIFNGEDIELETDFNAPLDSAKVVESVENKTWIGFLRKEKAYQKQAKELEMQINYFQSNTSDPYYTNFKQADIIQEYNNLQKERAGLIVAIGKKHPDLYASKLIRLRQQPFIDGNLSGKERKEILKSHYFDNIDFTDESLMNSPAYTDKVFKYLMLYAQRGLSKEEQGKEFNKAIDIILEKTKVNPNVSAFIVDYLMRGFESLGQDNLLAHLSNQYMVPHGCSDDRSTLKRRLAFQKMKTGDKVPDFTLSGFDGNIVNLYQSDTQYKLIVFWETSCPMCKEIFSQLRNWYFSRAIDLEVFSVSIDGDKAAWREYVAKSDYPWVNLNEPNKWDGKAAADYNLYATPTMFLVDNDNRILAKPIHFGEFLEAVSDW